MIVSWVVEEESHKPGEGEAVPGELLRERNSGRNALSLPLIHHWLLSHLHLTFAKPGKENCRC